MNSAIRDCLPPDRNPRKPKVVLPKGSIDCHVHVFEQARYVVAITMDVSDKELEALDKKGARGVRLNTDNKGGMPIGFDQIGELEAGIRPFGWHIEWLFPGKDILQLMPVFKTIKVPM